jgi:predicted nuclease of predicted toxin-antitoxin system
MNQILADESVDYQIVKTLRQVGYPVLAIAEISPSISDADVLNMAYENNALLLTEDKDFGELVYRFGMKHCGILLIRLIEYSSEEKARITVSAIQKHFDELKNVFAVLNENKLRIRQ